MFHHVSTLHIMKMILAISHHLSQRDGHPKPHYPDITKCCIAQSLRKSSTLPATNVSFQDPVTFHNTFYWARLTML